MWCGCAQSVDQPRPVSDRDDTEAAQVVVIVFAGRADHYCPVGEGELGGEQTDATGRGADKHGLPGLWCDRSGRPLCRVADETETSGGRPSEGGGFRRDLVGRHDNEVRLRFEVAPPEYLVTHCCCSGAFAHLVNHAGELGTLATRERTIRHDGRRLAHLRVEVVDARGPHRDSHLAGPRVRLVDLDDVEDLWPAITVVLHDSRHAPSLRSAL